MFKLFVSGETVRSEVFNLKFVKFFFFLQIQKVDGKDQVVNVANRHIACGPSIVAHMNSEIYQVRTVKYYNIV